MLHTAAVSGDRDAGCNRQAASAAAPAATTDSAAPSASSARFTHPATTAASGSSSPSSAAKALAASQASADRIVTWTASGSVSNQPPNASPSHDRLRANAAVSPATDADSHRQGGSQ